MMVWASLSNIGASTTSTNQKLTRNPLVSATAGAAANAASKAKAKILIVIMVVG
jgi:hypothetical protein